MHPGEYEQMSRVEDRHWWYVGLRDAIARQLERPEWKLPQRPRVLDAGCGTGANLRLLRERLDPAYLGGFDLSPEALALARQKAPGAEIYASDICAPELRTEPLDLITSLDVIYIPGTERALPGLERLVAALAPGGLLLLNLPAYNWLYSEHDVAIHTHQRYTAGEVRRLLERLGLAPALVTYRMFFLFKLVLLARLPTLFRARPGDPSAKSDLYRVPGDLTNRLCLSFLRLENRLLARGVRFPWGSSVFAIGRKS